MGSIKILETGFYTSIQDQGRKGYATKGTPESGAMDQESWRLSNLLLQNLDSAAALECTLVGPTILFLRDLTFVLTGASTEAVLEGKELVNNKIYKAFKGQILRVGKVHNGCRTYVGFDGGLDTETMLGSRSQFYPITKRGTVVKGDVLDTGLSNVLSVQSGLAHVKDSQANKSNEIQIIPGPEYHFLSEIKKDVLTSSSFTIQSWNRMGIALREPLEQQGATILTGPVLPGTIQLTPSGHLYILMRDCQVTGGYPRIAQLTQAAINKMGQKKTGDSIRLTFK